MAALVPATALHAAAMAAIHAAAFPPRERWGADAMALQLTLPGAFGLIAPQGGLILARVVVDEAEILTLAVAPDRQRTGIGGQLLASAEAVAAARSAVSMFLEVAQRNVAARALYARRGYIQIGLRKGYYADGDDALVLRRLLSRDAATAV